MNKEPFYILAIATGGVLNRYVIKDSKEAARIIDEISNNEWTVIENPMYVFSEENTKNTKVIFYRNFSKNTTVVFNPQNIEYLKLDKMEDYELKNFNGKVD